ncbi:uncharacterized protein [Palaemon carinicauda]|uniref:uncharacterized protein n=1 Tax=Palaemon carinicauda TaxID=392227 RepID=UPI0035B690E3
MVKKADEDARHNADLNGLDNVAIYTGKAEVNMNAVLAQCVKYKTVVVVDPPRAGLRGRGKWRRSRCIAGYRLWRLAERVGKMPEGDVPAVRQSASPVRRGVGVRGREILRRRSEIHDGVSIWELNGPVSHG